MNLIKVDLHSHTTHSDGRLTPFELIDRAISFDIDMLAMTDHDTMSALQEAHAYIKAKDLKLTLINGIEISTVWENKDIHIVGLNIDINNAQLKQLTQAQTLHRDKRARLIASRLEKHTQKDVYEAVKEIAGEAAITRAHFAKWLVDKGYAANMKQVFKKYLTRNNPGYVPPTWCAMEEAVSAIHAAGGQAVLAHPGRYQLTTKWLKRLIHAFVCANGDGMEVAQPQQSLPERRLLADLAIEHDLLVSQGSDFHYPSPWMELGKNLWLPSGVTPIWQDWPQFLRLQNERT